MWCNDSTLARNASDLGPNCALGTIFPIVITPTTYVFVHIYVDLFSKTVSLKLTLALQTLLFCY